MAMIKPMKVVAYERDAQIFLVKGGNAYFIVRNIFIDRWIGKDLGQQVYSVSDRLAKEIPNFDSFGYNEAIEMYIGEWFDWMAEEFRFLGTIQSGKFARLQAALELFESNKK